MVKYAKVIPSGQYYKLSKWKTFTGEFEGTQWAEEDVNEATIYDWISCLEDSDLVVEENDTLDGLIMNQEGIVYSVDDNSESNPAELYCVQYIPYYEEEDEEND